MRIRESILAKQLTKLVGARKASTLVVELCNCGNDIDLNINVELVHAFIWRHSPQGQKYWQKLNDRYKKGL